MNVIETTRSTRIAVFIDFDNVEIGVKNTIGGQFDIGLVLEAIKERGEIVTKIAYSDWKRAGDYSRLLTQHAIRMVQRNLTPGGDKNGADITMALDALEMAFTHDHINAFVIVGGDSDFISLVEKLKQYGRKVIVVGGRQFTSATMQRNCHEFIAYENLVGSRGGGRSSERGGRPSSGSGSDMAKVLPLVKRALKVLSEREVAPQLGLLKSTLLQLDSTFSEREYGASSFRDFMEKVAQTGAVTLKQTGRSMLVESRDGASDVVVHAAPHDTGERTDRPERPERIERAEPTDRGERIERVETGEGASRGHEPDAEQGDGDEEESLPHSPMSMQDGIRAVQQAFAQSATPIRWPMYVRQAKQYLRSAIDGFDERKYGFASVVDLLRAAGKEGVLRIERDRQGAVRIFAGAHLGGRPAPAAADAGDRHAEMPNDDLAVDEVPTVEAPIERLAEPVEGDTMIGEPVDEPPIVDVDVDGDGDAEPLEERQPDVEPDGTPTRKSGGGAGRGRRPVASRSAKAAKPKVAAKAPPRARKNARRKPPAA
jgi:uncharacterized protein (TIGR00288 family)